MGGGGGDRVGEKVKKLRDQGAGWFVVWWLTAVTRTQELGCRGKVSEGLRPLRMKGVVRWSADNSNKGKV